MTSRQPKMFCSCSYCSFYGAKPQHCGGRCLEIEPHTIYVCCPVERTPAWSLAVTRATSVITRRAVLVDIQPSGNRASCEHGEALLAFKKVLKWSQQEHAVIQTQAKAEHGNLAFQFGVPCQPIPHSHDQRTHNYLLYS